MAQRRSTGGNPLIGIGLILLVAAAFVAFLALRTFLTIAIYATWACLAAGLVIFEIRARPRPTITNQRELPAEHLLYDEASEIQALKLRQNVAQAIWFQLPALANLYGPLIVASCVAIATVLGVWFVDRHGSGPERSSIELSYGSVEYFVSQFMEPEPIAERNESEEEYADEKNEESVQEQSPYTVLGLTPNASRAEIMAAYHELVKQYHPDFQQSRGPELKELAEHKTQLLNWAKEEVLKRL